MLVFKGGNIISLVVVSTISFTPGPGEIIQFEEYLGICATGRLQLGYQKYVATKIWQGLKNPRDFQTDQMKRKRHMDSDVFTTEGLYRKIRIAFCFFRKTQFVFSEQTGFNQGRSVFFRVKKNLSHQKSSKSPAGGMLQFK